MSINREDLEQGMRSYQHHARIKAVLRGVCLSVVMAALACPLAAAVDAGADILASLSPEERGWLSENASIRVAVYPLPPYQFEEKGECMGYQVDLMRLACDRVGLTPDFSFQPLKETLDKLKTGDADVVPLLLFNEERTQFLDFSSQVLEQQMAIFARPGRDELSDAASLDHKVIASYTGYGFEPALRRFLPEARFVSARDAKGMLRLVASGEADAAVQELYSGEFVLREEFINNVRVAGIFQPDGMKMAAAHDFAVRKGLPLLNAILDKAWNSIAPSEKQKVWDHWFGAGRMADEKTEPGMRSQLALLSAGILAVLACILFLTRKLGDLSPYGLRSRRLKIIIVVASATIIVAVGAAFMIMLGHLEQGARLENEQRLQASLKDTQELIRLWFEMESDHLRQYAEDPDVIDAVKHLMQLPRNREALQADGVMQELRRLFEKQAHRSSDMDYAIVSPDLVNIASQANDSLGERNIVASVDPDFLNRAFKGQFVLVPAVSFNGITPAPAKSEPWTRLSSFVVIPLTGGPEGVPAVLVVRVGPGHRLSELCRLCVRGTSTDVYAVNSAGYFVTETRFAREMERLGLLKAGESMALRLRVADPGRKLQVGQLPPTPAQDWPLTAMAARVTERTSGSDRFGYRDYRGVRVLGAGVWDPILNLGLCGEIDDDEALALYYSLRRITLSILSICLLLTVFLVSFSFSENNRTNRAIVSARDQWEQIAQRKTAELHAHEEKFHAVFSQTTHLNGLLSPDGRVLESNQTALDFVGVREEDVHGAALWETPWANYSNELQQRVQAAVREAANGGVQHLETRILDVNKSTHEVNVTISPIRLGGKVEFLLIIGQDITEQKLAAKLLAASEERGRMLLDSVGEGIFGTDQSGMITFINTSALNILGYAADELVCRPAHTAFHHSHADGSPNPPETCPTQIAATRGERCEVDDDVFWRKDGSYFRVHVTAVPIFHEGRLAGAVTTFSDITVRKQAEHELRKLSRAIEASPACVMITDCEANIEYVNAKFQEVTGYTVEEVRGRNPRMLSAGLLSKSHYEELWQTILAGRQWRGEFCNKRKDGGIFWERASISPIVSDLGQITHFVAVKEDVTEQRASNERFRVLFESATDAHLLMDGPQIIDCNETAVRLLLAAGKQDILSRHPAEFSPEFQPDGQPSLEKGEVMRTTALEQDGFRFDWVHRKFNGEEFPVEVSLKPLQLDRRTVLLVVWHDLTERQRAENLLRESEGRFRNLFENAPVAYQALDERGCYVDANERLLELLGHSWEELRGRPFGDFFTADLQDLFRQQLANFDTQSQFDTELTLRTGSGRTVTVLNSVRIQHDGQGNFLLAHCILHDITVRQQMLEALTAARNAAEEANRAKSSFLATMSHEIRTPMNGVLGTVDVLRHTHLHPEQAELVEIIHDAAQGLLAIINDILDFSKIEAGKMELECHPVSICTLVESVCAALYPIAADKCVELVCFADPHLPECVLSDPVRLRQILTNLAGNAVKFSTGHAPQARVSVRAEWKGPGQVRFTVADNGVGMTPEVIDSLFTPFKQADGSITRRFGGTGLGLSICKNLVDMLHGSLNVKSAPGEGSVFTVTLPVEVTGEPCTRAHPADLAGLDCVLVGEDPETAADWRAYLEHAGARVTATGAPGTPAGRPGCETEAPPCVVVIDGLHDGIDLEQVRAAFAGHSGDLRYLLVKAGDHRRIRREEDDLFVLCCDFTRRADFLRAVALASGRVVTVEDEPRMPEPGRIAPPSVEEARAQGRLILVAEDNEINQKVIRHQLTMLGFACEIAANGRAALELWRAGRYGLLISDLHMPVMDGYSLAESIRGAEPEGTHIPIVAFTANISMGERERCMATGMDGHLTKPAPMAMFREVLDKWLPAVQDRGVPNDDVETAFSDRQDEVPSPAVLDTSVLAALVGGEPSLIDEFLVEYLGSVSKAAGEIRVAFERGDWSLAGALAHRLKSSSRSVGAMNLGDCCERLERAGKALDRDAVTALMPEFEQNVTDVVNAIVGQRRT